MWHGVPFARQRRPVVRFWAQYWGCAGCCGDRLTVFAVTTPPSSGRPQPASLCFRVREAQVPCSSTCCPGRPPRTLPHSAGRMCAGRVPCWLRVGCASWLTRVACAPARCPGALRSTVTAPSSLVLPTAVLSRVPSLAWPTIPFHGAPQGPQRWPTGCWIPWAQTNSGAVPQGPQDWLPGCLIPCAHWWIHRTPQGPTGCWVPWAQADTDFALQGPRVGPLGAPSPARTHPFTYLLRGPAGPLGVRSPGRPPCGVTRSPRRPLVLLCENPLDPSTPHKRFGQIFFRGFSFSLAPLAPISLDQKFFRRL